MGKAVISLRTARFGDYWRSTYQRAYPIRYASLQYSGLRNHEDDTVGFSRGITAIVGGNGVGKSTLAHAIVEAIAGDAGIADLRDFDRRIKGAKLEATLETADGKQFQSGIAPDGSRTNDPGTAHNCAWLDPSTMAMLCQNQILSDSNFADVLEGLTPRALTNDELALASFVIGKEFSSCEVTEIRDYGPLEVWPYFSITCNGAAYGSEDMGRGELALLTSLWVLDSSPKNSIIVLEEPETHASSRSQAALMDMLAWFCSKKGLSVIVTTHSPVVLQKIPKEHIRLVVSQGARSRLIPAPNLHEIAAIVGGGVAFKALLLVEDTTAEHFATALLEYFDPDLARQCKVAPCGGEAPLLSVLETLPSVRGWLYLIGCFDGDMRSKHKALNTNWPFVFLPGDTNPESLLRACVVAANAAALASRLHLPEQTVLVAIDAGRGLDPHDWLEEVSKALVRSKPELTRALVSIWARSNSAAAEGFLKAIRGAIAQM